MKLLGLAAIAALLAACSDAERRDVSYNRSDVREEQRSIEKSAEAQKEQIDAQARFDKERIEAESEASKKILEAEREKAAALNRAEDRRADATADINDDILNEPAGAEVKVRADNDGDFRFRSSLGLKDNKDVTVHLENGVATLKGHVRTHAEKADIEAKAKAFPGVSRVDNRLTVRD